MFAHARLFVAVYSGIETRARRFSVERDRDRVFVSHRSADFERQGAKVDVNDKERILVHFFESRKLIVRRLGFDELNECGIPPCHVRHFTTNPKSRRVYTFFYSHLSHLLLN